MDVVTHQSITSEAPISPRRVHLGWKRGRAESEWWAEIDKKKNKKIKIKIKIHRQRGLLVWGKVWKEEKTPGTRFWPLAMTAAASTLPSSKHHSVLQCFAANSICCVMNAMCTLHPDRSENINKQVKQHHVSESQESKQNPRAGRGTRPGQVICHLLVPEPAESCRSWIPGRRSPPSCSFNEFRRF